MKLQLTLFLLTLKPVKIVSNSRQLFHEIAILTENFTTRLELIFFYNYASQHKFATYYSYIPKIILSDKGTSFTSDLMHEPTQLLQNQLKYESLKHAQTNGFFERNHSALYRVLNILNVLELFCTPECRNSSVTHDKNHRVIAKT